MTEPSAAYDSPATATAAREEVDHIMRDATVAVPRAVVEAALEYLIGEHNDPRTDYSPPLNVEPGTGSAWAVIEALREALNA